MNRLCLWWILGKVKLRKVSWALNKPPLSNTIHHKLPVQSGREAGSSQLTKHEYHKRSVHEHRGTPVRFSCVYHSHAAHATLFILTQKYIIISVAKTLYRYFSLWSSGQLDSPPVSSTLLLLSSKTPLLTFLMFGGFLRKHLKKRCWGAWYSFTPSFALVSQQLYFKTESEPG